MHELSIAYHLIQTAEAAAREAGVTRVLAVNLKLGALAGVVRDALLFSYDIAAEGTLLAGSRLIIEEIPVVVYCGSCGHTATLPDVQFFACPHCGEPTADIRQGRELELVSLEIEDPADSPAVESADSNYAATTS